MLLRLRPVVPFVLAAACVAPPSPPRPPVRSLEVALERLLEAPVFAPARVGVLVRDLETGEDLVAHDAHKGFLTASNMKLLSSAVALVSLGADFRFHTRVVAGVVEDGIVRGDLWLVGDGDPSLGGPPETDPMAPMRGLARHLLERGVRRIDGTVRGDASAQPFAPYGHGWQWDYLEDDYAAPCAALNFAQNVRPAGDARGVVAVAEAANAAAAALSEALREVGIECRGVGDRGAAPDGAVVLAEHVSPTLAELVRPTLVHSINLYAEQLWRTAGHRTAGATTTSDLERHAKSVLRDLGVDPDGMVLADGSGLSRRSFVQPRQITALLARARTDERLLPLVDSLPVLGRTGTLRSRGRDTAAEGRVRAKTGFVSYVVALSGYVERPDGRAPLAFSILTNQFDGDTGAAKAAVDAFVVELAAHVGWSEPVR